MNKPVLVLIFCIIISVLPIYSQKIEGLYQSVKKEGVNFRIEIKDSILKVSHNYSLSDDILIDDIYFSSNYEVFDDTLSVFICDEIIHVFKIDSNFLEVITNELIWATKGTKFYKEIFYHEDGRPHLMGSTWENGKKDGYWIFFDSLGIGKGYIMFDNGYVLDTILFDELMYNKDTIP